MKCNNQRYLTFTKHPKYLSRTKYINIQNHFISEKIEMGVIDIKYCTIEDRLVDYLTNALIKNKHQKLKKVLGLKAFD